jgi:hypothetical protein
LVYPEFKQCLRIYLINQVAASSVVLDVGVEDKPRKKAPNVGEVQFVPIFDYHYLDNLRLILSNANSIKFIDPYLDPSGTNYKEFYQLISAIQRAGGAAPRIEVHRKYSGSPSDPVLTKDDWINRFKKLSATLTTAKLKIEVFVWDDFHDRYLISNLIGINLNNGFDISTANDMTTWNKLSRQVREDINKEFTPDSLGKKSLVGERKLIYRFTIPDM